MQTLHCAVCDHAPLDTPRLVAGTWYAQCPDCLTDNVLEPDYSNVFLPVRFRVCLTGAPSRRGERGDAAQPPA
ncbi:MAG: hypothetical protein JNM90_10790 [Burkholderiales bacterium]|nr:hypothetical protein [Burkholderiales bacterium]